MLGVRLKEYFLSLCVLLLLSACGNGVPEVPDTTPNPDGLYEVSVSIEGVRGDKLKLRLNQRNAQPVSENGTFTFDEYLKSGEEYQVFIDTNPTQPNQQCTIENGNGRVDQSDVTDVEILCTTIAYELGGIVQGLSGGELVLKANDEQSVSLTDNGEFTFSEPVLDGSEFTIEIEALPNSPKQACSLSNANGVFAGSDYLDIAVECSIRGYTLGGEVNGLLGTGLVLINNDSDSINISEDGQFEFENRVTDGSAYSVEIDTQPESPNQVCQVQNADGTIEGAGVSNLSVSCATRQYSLQGRIVGLKGEGLEVTVNSERLEASFENGALEFLPELDDHSDYSVSVSKQPANPSQTCEVSNGSGKVDGANVDDILLVCETVSFNVGGSVSGLQGDGLVLQLNGAHDLSVESDGGFSFSTLLEDQSEYAVSVKTEPTSPEQNCRVTNGEGSLSGGDVSNILVSCNNTYAIGGTLEGLAEGAHVVLQLNGQDSLFIENNGSFVFPSGLKAGEEYAVSVKDQPQGPNQVCTLSSSTGTVASGDVLEVGVSCETQAYKVGVQVNGLVRSGLVLQNNGGDDLIIDSDGAYQFSQPVPDHATYDISVLKTPKDLLHRCDINDASGQINGAPITGVEVNCNRGVEVDGVISGLVEGNSVKLINNETDTLELTTNGEFVFNGLLIQGEEYRVEVKDQPEPIPQVCSVEDGAGTAGSNIYGIEVTCVLPKPELSLTPEPVKKLNIEWDKVQGAEEYRLFENKDGQSGFEQIASFEGDVSSYQLDLAILKRLDAQYTLEVCAAGECVPSQTVQIDESIIDAVGYYKASNTDKSDNFGHSVAVSGDGSTMAVGAKMERSSAQGVDGDQSDNSLAGAGAVYVYTKISDQWVQQAYIKPSNPHESQYFGESLALNDTGDILVVGAPGDSSAATGVDGDQEDRSAPDSGAVFAFSQNTGTWQQEAYIKASNARSGALFGNAVSLTGDGSVLAVGSIGESSGDSGDPSDTSAPGAGAVYKFQHGFGGSWNQTEYIKARGYNLHQDASFGYSLDCISVDCSYLYISAPGSNSDVLFKYRGNEKYDASSKGKAFIVRNISGGSDDVAVGYPYHDGVGKVFIFDFSLYSGYSIGPKHPVENSRFGASIAISRDGRNMVVGAPGERLDGSGIDDQPVDNNSTKSGAVYIYQRESVNDRFQQSDVIYLKPRSNDSSNHFGTSVAISDNGNVLGVGVPGEAGSSVGIDGNQEDNSMPFSGSVFMY